METAIRIYTYVEEGEKKRGGQKDESHCFPENGCRRRRKEDFIQQKLVHVSGLRDSDSRYSLEQRKMERRREKGRFRMAVRQRFLLFLPPENGLMYSTGQCKYSI